MINQIIWSVFVQESNSIQYRFQKIIIRERPFFSIHKYKKWSQDSEFHPENTRLVCFTEETFRLFIEELVKMGEFNCSPFIVKSEPIDQNNDLNPPNQVDKAKEVRNNNENVNSEGEGNIK